MGKRVSTSNGKNVKLVPTFIHPWVRSKVRNMLLSLCRQAKSNIVKLFLIHLTSNLTRDIFVGNEKSSKNV